MTGLESLSPGAVDVPEPESYEATILEDATAGDPVRVTYLVLGPELSGDACPWMPYVTGEGVYYPKKGDKAWVIRPVQGPPAIACWVPAAVEPDHIF